MTMFLHNLIQEIGKLYKANKHDTLQRCALCALSYLFNIYCDFCGILKYKYKLIRFQ